MTEDDLRKILRRIDGKGYKAYKGIRGVYEYPKFTLFIDHVQGDPFATPSKIRLKANQDLAQFPADLYRSDIRKEALEDCITRKISLSIAEYVKGKRGTGNSGKITVQKCGQEVLKRTSVVVSDKAVEARLSVGLPAAGRRILAAEAEVVFFKELPQVAEELYYSNYEAKETKNHVDVVEDQYVLRKELAKKELVAFIGEGTILPRISGVSDRPMSEPEAVVFASDSLQVTFELPHRGKVEGMGIPQGILLIVGGGYHGKTTLLKAIERGVYNHIPGDGRELVVTVEDAVKIRAEDGRRIEKVNISPFIQNLPQGVETDRFCTDNASGSTSQAANIMEALEVGTSLLLIDEDTSATNFMIRDERMQELVSKDKEPITPFIDKARLLYEEQGVSSIIVIGGSGDYFDVADIVIMMDKYLPREVTNEAKKIAEDQPVRRTLEGGPAFGKIVQRIPKRESFNPMVGKKVKVKAQGENKVIFGRETIDVSYLEQLVDGYQNSAIAQLILYAYHNYLDGKRTMKAVLEELLETVRQKGLDILALYPGHPGEFALPRRHELAAAINRLRSLKVKQKPGEQV